MRSGRRKPYTEIGITRLKCVRCGRKAEYQWSVCANSNLWMGICRECDIKLNELALKFMRAPYRNKLMKAYKKFVRR